VTVLALKIGLAPGLVCVATLAARRWGPRVSGVMVALPLVAGPILLVITLERGNRFGADAARHALMAIAALCAFALAFAYQARTKRWPTALLVAWCAYAVVAAVASQTQIDALAGLVCALVIIALTRTALSRIPHGARAPALRPPPWDLPLRLAATMVLVVAVTSTSKLTGAALSGVLTPFPIATAIVGAFTLARQGPAASHAFIRGFVDALPAFALIFTLLALVLG